MAEFRSIVNNSQSPHMRLSAKGHLSAYVATLTVKKYINIY